MSDTPRTISLLLPAYLNGTLSAGERDWVEGQLTIDAQARTELEELRALRTDLRAHWSQTQAPDPQVRARVMANMGPSPKAPRLATSLESWMRWLFAPRWMPAAALALIVIQLGLLVSIAVRPPVGGDISARSVATPQTRFRLVLQPQARQSDIVALLQELRAQVVAGPDRQGAFVIAVATTDPQRVSKKIAAARTHTIVVSSIEVVPP